MTPNADARRIDPLRFAQPLHRSRRIFGKIAHCCEPPIARGASDAALVVDEGRESLGGEEPRLLAVSITRRVVGCLREDDGGERPFAQRADERSR